MPYVDEYEYEMDRATSRLELIRYNPTRSFIWVDLNAEGKWTGSPALFSWQNGVWYDSGRNVITDESLVPQKFRDEIAASPPKIKSLGPAVTWVCEICGEKMNESDSNEHLLKHYREKVEQAGALAVPPEVPQIPGETRVGKHDANQHGRR